MTEHYPPFELAAYFDGAMPNHDADAIERHLTACPACRSTLASMAGARRAVQLLPVPDVPDNVWARIDRRLEPAHPLRTMAAARPPRRWGADPVRQPSADVQSAEKASYDWRWGAAIVGILALGMVLVASPLGSRLTAAVQPVGINYGEYLAGLTDRAAMERFETAYERRRLPIRSAGSLADVLVGEDLIDPPGDLIPRTAYTLSDDGVRAVEVTYVLDQSLVEVFRQPAHHPIRLDGFSAREVYLGSVPTLFADGPTHTAVTFTAGSDRYVIVARRDEPAVRKIVEAFAGVN